jgi:hypothetical protein
MLGLTTMRAAATHLRTTPLLGVLLLAFGLGCNPSYPQESCGASNNNLPACPAGAFCNGPCDLDASVTVCGTLACSSECRIAVPDAGAVWECQLP